MWPLRLTCVPSLFLETSCIFARGLKTAVRTQDLQRVVDDLPLHGALDCGNQRYVVTSRRLNSNMTIPIQTR
jgi:hypothetical protein